MKRLSQAFRKAQMHPGEPFQVMMPSYEKDGYRWRLHPQSGVPPHLISEKAIPDRPSLSQAPKGRVFNCQAPEEEGACVFRVELWRPGTLKPPQSHTFEINVKR